MSAGRFFGFRHAFSLLRARFHRRPRCAPRASPRPPNCRKSRAVLWCAVKLDHVLTEGTWRDGATELAGLREAIEAAWEARDALSPATTGPARDAVERALGLLDGGSARVAERGADGAWVVNEWLKKAVLLSFRLNDMTTIDGGPGGASWWDKVPSKFAGWGDAAFRDAGFRAVPHAVVRRSAYIAKGVVLMPSFVNLGAYVDEGTMIDTWATVGSCAQIGKNCHISGGAGIGGVLEPLQASR